MTHPVKIFQPIPLMLMQVPPLNPDEEEAQQNEDITRDIEKGSQSQQCAVTNRKYDISYHILFS